MSQCLIGYQTMIPENFTAREKKILHEHLDNLEKLLKTPNLAKLIVEESDAHGKYLKQLNRVCLYIPNEINNQGYFSEDHEEEVQELIDEVLSLINSGREFIEKIELEGEDLSWRYYNILSRRYLAIFAGETTYGDEPDGRGYNQLKDLDKIELLSAIERLTIPSSNSEHFIKDCTTDS